MAYMNALPSIVGPLLYFTTYNGLFQRRLLLLILQSHSVQEDKGLLSHELFYFANKTVS